MSNPKHITMQMWSEAGSFDRIANAGDTVDNEIVEQFRNSLPPIVDGEAFMQAGGAYDNILIKDLGVYAPIYTTFEKRPAVSNTDGLWVYVGNCLRGTREDCTKLSEH